MFGKTAGSLMALAFIMAVATSAGAADVRAYGNIIGELVAITGDPAVDLDVRFEINSAKLTEEATRQLDELGKALTAPQLAQSKIEINGHTDASGDAAYNKKLSQKRAESVKNYLVSVYRINPQRLTAVGWGEERLKNTSDPNAADNRRVEIVNLTPPQPPAKQAPPQLQAPPQPSVPVQPVQPAVPMMQPPAPPPAPAPAQGLEGGQGSGGYQTIN